MSQVPAATRTLRVLRFLAAQPDPVPLERLAAALDLPRSTAYHLVNAMIEQGFVTHIAEDRRYCLGVAAFEVGIGYARQAPLQRIAHRPLAALVDRIGQSAHLAVPHGRDVLYVLEERAPGRRPLVTDVGVRLPAHLTASGRAIMAALPENQVRALYPDRERVRRPARPRTAEPPRAAHGAERGPARAATRPRTARSLRDSPRWPWPSSTTTAPRWAGIATTYDSHEEVDLAELVEAVSATATTVSRRLGPPSSVRR